MRALIFAAVTAIPFALILSGCAAPAGYSNASMSTYDKDTEYRVDDTASGFTLTIYHSRYQFVPETDAVAVSCRQALTSLAYEIADKRGKEIAPVNEQRIKMSFGRNGFSGITSCSATVPVEWAAKGEPPAVAGTTVTELGKIGTSGRQLASTGTGFIVSQNGEVLTNHHVVSECGEVRVRQAGTEGTLAAIIAKDAVSDLALVRPPNGRGTVATFREGRGIRQGDAVVVVGYPLQGLLASDANITTGTVSALAGLQDDTRYLQLTAPIQPGNSGGPLLDMSGNVVGIVVAKLDAMKVAELTGDIPQNVNFAIKDTVVRSFLDAKGVDYQTARHKTELSAADVGESAKRFTVLVECWR